MKFVWKAIEYIVLMNAFVFVLCCVFGGDFAFSFIYSIVVPVVCAHVAWARERRKEKMTAQH